MADAIRNFLADGERAPAVLINAAVTVLATGLVVAVGAIYLMR
jgi:hypothetical protein